ncbi:MAG: CopG family ribbon-helix-helix protein [Anaerolineales bacterium]
MTTKVMVSFPDEFLTRVDEVAESEHRSRSELIREALRLYIAARGAAQRPIDRPAVRAAVASMDALAARMPGTGEDSTEEIRYWREKRR